MLRLVFSSRKCWGLAAALYSLFTISTPPGSQAGGPAPEQGAPAYVRAWFTDQPADPERVFRADPSYSYGDPTEAEQAHLEAINRARLDPSGEAARFGISLLEGVPAGQITPAPSQPLTFNATLHAVALMHSEDMIRRDYFAHDSPEGKSPGDRILEGGYSYSSAGENLALRGSTAPLDEFATVLQLHADLFIDDGYPGRGHRVNILRPGFKEVGIGVAFGDYDGFPNSYMLTADFGTSLSNPNPFVLGVIYEDRNRDGVYGQGEGLTGVEIRALEAGQMTATASAGGYGMRLPPGDYTLEARLADGRSVRRNVRLSSLNLKQDFLLSEFSAGSAGPPAPVLLANGSTSPAPISASTPLTLAIGMDAGSWSGRMVDWWLVYARDSEILYLDPGTLLFVPGLLPTLQAPLAGFDTLAFFSQPLSPGTHVFCFAVDGNPNGLVDLDSLHFACVVVTVN